MAEENAAPLPPVEGLAFQSIITSVSKAKRPNSIAILGKFKVGKTTLAASASRIPSLVAAEKQVLILEAERGTASIAEEYPEVDQAPITTFQGLNMAIEELCTKQHPYGVVVIDTFDKFQELAVDYHLAATPNDTRAAYGRVKVWTEAITWKLHNAPFLVIFLFHETDDKNEKTAVTTTTFSLVGSAKDKLGQVFDIISRLTVETDEDGNNVRMLQLSPATGMVTGSRYESKLPSVMPHPTIPKIFELIEAPTTNTTDKKE